MSIETVIAGKSGPVNPLANIAGLMALMVPALVSFDPITPLCVLACGLTLFFAMARPGIGSWLRLAGPFLFLSLGIGLVNLVFTESKGSTMFYALGPVQISEYSIQRALSVSARSLALTALCTLAATAMSAIALVRALMQQAKLNPVFGFSLFAGLNALPQLGEDIRQMERIRVLRAGGRRRPFGERLALPVILLAGAIRRAERASLSMAARGLEGIRHRSFVVVSVFRARDWIFIAVCVAASVLCLYLSTRFGWFRFDLG